MSLLSLAHYTAFLIYAGLVFYVLAKNPTARLNRNCALILVSFVIWNFANSFVQYPLSKNSALRWVSIASFGWCNFAGFSLWFALVFTKQEKILKQWYFYSIIFLFPVIFIYKQWTGYLINDLSIHPFGWLSIWAPSIWSWLFYLYYFSCMAIAFFLVNTFGKNTKLTYEKKQAKVILFTGLTPLILGTFTDIILTKIKVIPLPPVGPILSLIWAGGITYAITKYKLMVLTPAYAASDILATMNDSLILVNPEGTLIEANNATLKLLGYTRNEIIDKPAAILFSDEVPLFKDPESKKIPVATTQADYAHASIHYRTKIGENIPISFTDSVLRDQDHNIIGIVFVAKDMRETLRLQESEREFVVEKIRSEALQERARELQDAYDKLRTIQAQLIQSEKLAAVGQLAGGVAHEINNPLGVILGFAQSITKRIPEDDPLYHPLKSIEREAVRCKKLVGDLLTFSRAGKTQAEIIDINTIIDETLSLIEIQTKVKNIEIIKEYGSGLPQITANKNQLQQVIMNLCNNAIDAMPDGGYIIISTGNNEKRIEINIRDTGHGMTEEVKKHLFEPFYTTKEIGKGTGLGLSLCYEIIRKHQGVIEAESEVGKSSTFR
ncbi:MAG TPA: ATP-binding protein, partial [Bacillota bacterium]|nr:ATP-binding protein [Bacillota bacterium]